ncbi:MULTISPECIES: hypothetical protein [Dickeya]|uniref:Uncharacterized protein n=1 Tax=Dickeya aquatica TaxID=1401087 RepID=A0A375AEC8_9GAMM|nr:MULTISPECIES: hypothetical protein [Dickeya]SLM64448.1 hypothetical protein DAQ1742_03654 [Dickeya aquatica]
MMMPDIDNMTELCASKDFFPARADTLTCIGFISKQWFHQQCVQATITSTMTRQP